MIDDIKRDREAAPAMPFRLIGCDCEQDCVHDDHNRLVKKRRSRVPDMEARILSDADRIAALEAKVKAADELAEAHLHGMDDGAYNFNPAKTDAALTAYREVQS